jgi:hypothetical protein
VPLLNGCVHELLPEYVPSIVEGEVAAVPFVVIVHVGEPDTVPAEMASVHVSVDPDSVPDRLPVDRTVRESVETVADPVTLLPVCVNVHVIRPGPEESDALPAHAPVRPCWVGLGCEGAVGLDGEAAGDEEPLFPHAHIATAPIATTSRLSTTGTPARSGAHVG